MYNIKLNLKIKILETDIVQKCVLSSVSSTFSARRWCFFTNLYLNYEQLNQLSSFKNYQLMFATVCSSLSYGKTRIWYSFSNTPPGRYKAVLFSYLLFLNVLIYANILQQTSYQQPQPQPPPQNQYSPNPNPYLHASLTNSVYQPQPYSPYYPQPPNYYPQPSPYYHHPPLYPPYYRGQRTSVSTYFNVRNMMCLYITCLYLMDGMIINFNSARVNPFLKVLLSLMWS